jgi:4'-phosphopantetheinyl transferase
MEAGRLTEVPQTLTRGTAYLVWENIRDLSVPQDQLFLVLSEEERQRAGRFRLEDDRLRSHVAWGLLRIFLGRILGVEPRTIEFTRNEFQKPLLPNGPSFSMAHSGEWVLLGVTSEGRLGVDVEAPQSIPDLDDLAGTVFSTDELTELRNLPEAERLFAFFRGWTRKEALVKAIGGGLSVPLKKFAVSLAPDVAEALRWIDLPSERVESWSLRPLPDMPDALRAFAWDRALEEVRWIDPASLFEE